ncbi:MAG TPA: lanthionine synthetase LanC family protein [Marmoricola sp.]|nr:lanthionine synthetase LanC family protein [Marmoricola sp.]
MSPTTASPYRDVAEAAWRWVLGEVRYDDAGPWIPAAATDGPVEPTWDRDGLHSGIGGLAHVLAEIRACRPWTEPEEALAAAIAERVRSQVATQTDATYFDGLVSTIGVLVALDEPGVEPAVARLVELVTPDGWPQTTIAGPRYVDGARVNDLTLGTAGVLVGALWARRHGVDAADELVGIAADVLLAEAEPTPTGTNWSFVPQRFVAEPPAGQMPNLSHGLAGIAAALAAAGIETGRPDLVQAATSGAEHLVTLADPEADGFVVPRTIPPAPDMDEVTYTWCHGPTGTSLLFRALERGGVGQVAGAGPSEWHRQCLHAVRTSGLPARRWPGFWDNDGRCCGTAGVGDVFLGSWHRSGDPDDLAFALELADTLVERAIHDGDGASWRFIEHRKDDPLLPPGVGWMQGAAGIAAYLFHVSRVAEHGAAARPIARMDTWWAL